MKEGSGAMQEVHRPRGGLSGKVVRYFAGVKNKCEEKKPTEIPGAFEGYLTI